MADGTDDTAPEPIDGAAAVAVDELAPPTRRPRLRALWGALAVLAIAGGALAVVAADDDPDRLPVALGGATEEGRNATAAADLSMRAWVRYVAGDDLPVLGGEGDAYELAGEVRQDDVERLLDALGVDAEPTHAEQTWRAESDQGVVEVYEGYGGSWWFSQQAPDAATSSSGGSSGSSGSGECPPDAGDCVVSSTDAPVTTLAEPPVCDAAGRCEAVEPAPITPPEDLPTKAEAEAIALDLFRATGAEVDGAKVTVDGPYDAWYVSVEPLVDGMTASGLYFNASIGSDGEVLNAGGVLVQPERTGSYPLVDTRAAIDRLNDGTAYGNAAGDALAIAEAEPEVPATTTIASPDGGGVAGDRGSDQPILCDDTGTTVDPAANAASEVAPTEPMTTDTTVAPLPARDPATDPATLDCSTPPSDAPSGPVEVVLHEAERILVMLPASDGSSDAYLVPGYRMTGEDGSTADVPAVDDDSLLPIDEPSDDPATTEPAVDPGATEPGSSGQGSVDPAVPATPADPGAGADPDQPATRCAQPEPGPDGAVPDICLDPNSVP